MRVFTGFKGYNVLNFRKNAYNIDDWEIMTVDFCSPYMGNRCLNGIECNRLILNDCSL